MTQEEKAKAYDRVSKEVKDFFEGRQKMYSDVTQTLEYLFPELKESEDEKIRKELIEYLKERKSCESYGQYVVRYDRWIAWLEKQGEKGTKGNDREIPFDTWSEEDERMCTKTIFALAGFMGNEDKIDWLKSLKDRYTWKPSEEQMDALEKECIAHSNYELCRLLEQLKKLK